MELKINIDKDTDLREFIKAQMKGQIDALAREDLKEYLIAELQRKLAGKGDYVDSVVKETVRQWFNGWNVKSKIDAQITALFEEHIVTSLGRIMVEKDWTNVIEKLAQKKFEQLIMEHARK